MLTKHAYTRFVKGGNPHVARNRANQICHAMTHLFCGLVRKRDGQNFHGVNALGNEPSDSLREYACFARASTSDDQ